MSDDNRAKSGIPNQTVENAEREDVEAVAFALFSSRAWNQSEDAAQAWGTENRIQEFVREDYRTMAQAALDLLKSRGRYPREKE